MWEKKEAERKYKICKFYKHFGIAQTTIQPYTSLKYTERLNAIGVWIWTGCKFGHAAAVRTQWA